MRRLRFLLWLFCIGIPGFCLVFFHSFYVAAKANRCAACGCTLIDTGDRLNCRCEKK